MGKEKPGKVSGKLAPENAAPDSNIGGGLRAGNVAPSGSANDSGKHRGMAKKNSDETITDYFSRALDVSVRRDIDLFIGNIELGIDCWIKAGEVLVRMKKADPDVFNVISKLHPWVTRDVLETMHSIGLKSLHPRVLLLPPAIASSVAAMPYDAQKYVVESNAEVAVKQDGNHSKMTSIKDLTRKEADRVFRPSGIVEPEQQIFVKTDLLGVWELSVLGTTLHARRVSNGITGRTVKIHNGIAYVRLVK